MVVLIAVEYAKLVLAQTQLVLLVMSHLPIPSSKNTLALITAELDTFLMKIVLNAILAMILAINAMDLVIINALIALLLIHSKMDTVFLLAIISTTLILLLNNA